ncbi:MAG: hypothetical protein IKG80_06025 [Clostridia bacterium]|nr:hypothetical protein [Clostridia bacterium]
MKKIVVIIISFFLILCIVSCSNNNNSDKKSNNSVSTEETKDKKTESSKNETQEESQEYYIEAYPGANCISVLGTDGDVSVEYCCPLCGKEFSGFAYANLSDFGNSNTYIYESDEACTEHEYTEWFTWTVQFVKVPK